MDYANAQRKAAKTKYLLERGKNSGFKTRIVDEDYNTIIEVPGEHKFAEAFALRVVAALNHFHNKISFVDEYLDRELKP